MDPTIVLCLLGGIVVVGIVLLINAIRSVPEYQRLVVFRLGRVLEKPAGPGIVFLIPILDRPVRVDLREQIREVPHQVSITKDNAPISIDFLWYFKVIEPTASIVAVGNFELSAAGMATTTLRSVICGITRPEVLCRPGKIYTTPPAQPERSSTRWVGT